MSVLADAPVRLTPHERLEALCDPGTIRTIRSGAVRSPTSAVTASVRPPISSRTASSSSARRPTSTTASPFVESSRAVAAPIPVPAPVTIATRVIRGLSLIPSYASKAK